MNSPVAISQDALIHQLRTAHSADELVHLLKDTYHQVSEVSDETGWNQLSNSLLQQLNSINPLYIDDAREWNMIKLSRVFIYRISTHQLAY